MPTILRKTRMKPLSIGVNLAVGANEKPWFDVGRWRIEIQPQGKRKYDDFLVMLTPALDAPRMDSAFTFAIDGPGRGVQTDQSAILFVKESDQDSLTLTLPIATTLRIFGLPSDTAISLSANR